MKTPRCRTPVRVAAIGLLCAALPAEASALAPPPSVTYDNAALPAWARGLNQTVAPLVKLGSTQAPARRSDRLVLHTRALGLSANGRADATQALQAALDSLRPGGTLVIDPGVYLQTDCLVVRRSHVRIIGRQARLHAINDRMCFRIDGDDVTLEGLEFTASATTRRTEPENARIVVNGRGNRVAGNRVIGGAAAGIFVQAARDFAIIDNAVSGTLADGIHITGGAAAGYVARNTTNATGDDGIAVVSYLDSARCARILIENNRVSNVRSARGIAVIGGSDIVVRGNIVDGTGRAAGIIVAREAYWKTHGVDHVVVADNTVTDVARRFDLSAGEQTGHGTVDLNALSAPSADLRVRRVAVIGNVLARGATNGIRLQGAVCDIAIISNRISAMGDHAIAVINPQCQTPLSTCTGNEVDDPNTLPPACRAPAKGSVEP